MLANWVFVLAAALIGIAEIQYALVLRKQIRLFKEKNTLQPLKYMLFGAVLLIMVGAAPLGFVYLNVVWFHLNAAWIVYVAVLANAFAKVVIGFILNMIYRFKGGEDEVV